MDNTATQTRATPRKLVRYQTQQADAQVQIEYADQSTGPVVCILPSLARSGRDYDVVASFLQQDGFRVIRPEPW